jgi:hypothetical protein
MREATAETAFAAVDCDGGVRQMPVEQVHKARGVTRGQKSPTVSVDWASTSINGERGSVHEGKARGHAGEGGSHHLHRLGLELVEHRRLDRELVVHQLPAHLHSPDIRGLGTPAVFNGSSSRETRMEGCGVCGG